MRSALRYGMTITALGAMLLGVVALAPAHADDYRDIQRSIHHDIDAIHRDQSRLDGLYHKLDDQRWHHNWRGQRKTQEQIDQAKIDLDRDRQLLRADQHALDRLRR